MRNRLLILLVGVALLAATAVLVMRKRGGEPAKDAKRIVLYNWSDYMDPQVLKDFEAETGIEVVEEIFDSNETVRAKLLAGADGYDVLVPSGVMIETLIRENLLEALDVTKLSNLPNLDPFFRGLYFDPQNAYSVPYLWGSTGIGYRSDLLTTQPEGWASLFDPKVTQAYKGKVSLLDDPRETIAAALQYLGYSVNSTDPEEIEAAVRVLNDAKKNLSRYDSEVYGDFLAAGDLLVGHGWAGAVIKASFKNPKIGYLVPKEGGIMGVDCFVIPKTSKHKDEAHQFINYVLRADVAGKIVNKTFYPSANKAAEKFIKKELLENKAIYPERARVEKMEWLKDVGVHNELYEKAWEKVRYTN